MISIVICSIDGEKFEAVARMFGAALTAGSYEVIRIGDAKSLAEGYNRGLEMSRGETILFAHDDIEILGDDFSRSLDRAMNQFDLVGIAGTDRLMCAQWQTAGPPHLFGQVAYPQRDGEYEFVLDILNVPDRRVGNIEAVDGVFLAARRGVAETIRFDAATFDGFHLYDVDFSYRAHLGGFKLGVACDIHLLHASRGQYDERWM